MHFLSIFSRTFQAFIFTSLVLVSLTLPGCSQGFHRDDLARSVRSGPLEFRTSEVNEHITADDIRTALSGRAQLSKPFRLAILLDPDTQSWDFRWDEHDREILQRAADKLKRLGCISDYTLISPLVAESSKPNIASSEMSWSTKTKQTQLDAIRLAAAKYQADAVLIVRGGAQTDQYSNPLSALYLTLIGFFIVPGTQIDAISYIDGALFDVRNGVLYASADGEGSADTMGPLVSISKKDVIAKAKRKALEAFQEELTDQLNALH